MKTIYTILIVFLICLTSLADQATFDNVNSTGATTVLNALTSDLAMDGMYTVTNQLGLQMSYSGTWAYTYPFVLHRSICTVTNTVMDGIGMVNRFNYSEAYLDHTGLTSLVFSNLISCSGDFSPSSLLALTNLSLPVLTQVGGSFSPAALPALTNLSLPVLTQVGGSFSPSALPALTNLSLPSLTYVGGYLTPNGMPYLTDLSLDSLTYVTDSFSPYNMGMLTDISLPALVSCGSFNPNGMASLTNIYVPSLTLIIGSGISIYSMPSLRSLEFPALTSFSGFISISGLTNLTSLSFPVLTHNPAGSSFTPFCVSITNLYIPLLMRVGSSFGPANMTNLTSLSGPSLQFVGDSFNPANMASLTTLDFPVLTNIVIAFNPNNLPAITNIAFPALARVGTSGFQLYNMGNLQSIELTNIVTVGSLMHMSSGLTNLANVNIGTVGLTTNLNGSLFIATQKLTVASISNNLAVLNSLDGTAGKQYWGTGLTYTCNAGTSAGLSTWGPQMYTWKTNIQLRGGTVTANP